MQVFVTINKDGMKINANVNANNWLKKKYLIKDLFGIPVTVNATVINYVILESIYIMKTVNAEKKLVTKLVEECTETDDEVRMAKITLAEYEKEWQSSSTLYTVLFSVFLTISIGISTVFVYFYWYSKDEVMDNINPKSNLLNITNEILNK